MNGDGGAAAMEPGAGAGRQRALLRQVSAGPQAAGPQLPVLAAPHAVLPAGAGLEGGGRRRLVRAAAARVHRGLRRAQRSRPLPPGALDLQFFQ